MWSYKLKWRNAKYNYYEEHDTWVSFGNSKDCRWLLNTNFINTCAAQQFMKQLSIGWGSRINMVNWIFLPYKAYLPVCTLSSQCWGSTGWVLAPSPVHIPLLPFHLISQSRSELCTQDDTLLQESLHTYMYGKDHHPTGSQAATSKWKEHFTQENGRCEDYCFLGCAVMLEEHTSSSFASWQLFGHYLLYFLFDPRDGSSTLLQNSDKVLLG
jgi:hypothetical protein